jgi:hypothetical protein
MATTIATPDTMSNAEQEAHERAVQATAAEIAGYLQRLVGQRITADMAGTRDPKGVGKWARGEQMPHGSALSRLRTAYQIALLLESVYPPPTVRAWFVQMNPYLDHHAPASRIGVDPRGVYHAARAFVAGY